jgi:probable HAF family extracellular repeat protein
VSGDGLKIVGQSSLGDSEAGRAFLWSGHSMQDLGVLAGQISSTALEVSDDGSTVLGYCTDADFNITAMIWQSGVGMTSLRDALLSRGVGLTGWDMLESALHISADGRFIVDNGVFNGESRGFVADLGMTVPAPGASGLLGLAAAVGEKPASLETHRIRAG